MVIAGTGRAGTSFLVRFLGECGLDVGSSDDFFDDRAKAGLEHRLLSDGVPYVVKDPWLFTYGDNIDPAVIEIDALLVPVRELMAAATSRILQERIAMAEGHWASLPPREVNGTVTGGAVYSLDPVDEARILAVGFHRLIYWATARQVPLYLLEFPRTVNDGEYLIETLWPWLHAHCDRERARTAFLAAADPHLVHAGGLAGAGMGRSEASEVEMLDRHAMAILLKERESLLAGSEAQLAETEARLGIAEAELAETVGRLGITEAQLAETVGRLGIAEAQLAETVGRLGITEAQRANAETLFAQRNAALGELQARLDTMVEGIEAMRKTLSWRVTRPLRWIRSVSRGQPTER